MSTPPAPEYRVEWTGRIEVYVPVRPRIWVAHTSRECNAFTGPNADCDCGEGLTA